MVLIRFRQDVRPDRVATRVSPILDLDAAIARVRYAWDTAEACAGVGDWAGALAWLDRAHRLAPHDQNIAFSLAGLRLHTGDMAGATALFGPMASRFDTRECWIGLAAARFLCGDVQTACHAMQRALSSHTVDQATQTLADQIAAAADMPGWCGVRQNDTLVAFVSNGEPVVILDEQVIRPPSERGTYKVAIGAQTRLVQVTSGGKALLGSPIHVDRIRRLEGVVSRTKTGIEGWAWFPAAPDCVPELRIITSRARFLVETTLAATHRLASSGDRPLAQPRGFSFLVDADQDVQVLGSDGRHLLGSPLPAHTLPPRGTSESLSAQPVAEADLPIAVIIPVHRGLHVTIGCLESVLATTAPPHRIIVVDDATPEPELAAVLDRLTASGAIELLRPARNPVGFPAAVNAALKQARFCHVVLLNSDTLVAPGWLEALRAAACSALEIGTATPLSNEATIFSVPDHRGGNPAPDLAGTRALASLAWRANAGRLVDVPTAHGFCMFIRRDCLAATGPFDSGLFAQGYGEENDFCERARARGYRHVAVPGVYVAHLGGVSFGAGGQALLRRNLELLQARHPGYASRVAAFIAADPLAPARRRLDAARWRARPEAGRAGGSLLLITHGGGGGTSRVVAERARWARSRGLRPVVLLARDGRCWVGDETNSTPNLSYALPAELGQLRKLIKAERPISAELHHLLGHDHSILEVLRESEIPYDVWVHDYAWFCARLSYVKGDGRFCGEAPPSVCETCLTQWGRGIDDPIAPGALRARSAADFRAARRVVVPSSDVASRVRRNVSGVVPVTELWETPFPTPAARAAPRRAGGLRRVAVVGAIGLEKGVEVLLDCARDVATRGLQLAFTVVGYTSQDDALMATGCVFITGEFTASETTGLIRAQESDLAFLPSVWPETWCFALSDAWQAGLPTAVFDIGTPALRVRQTGSGWVLPLGLPASRINDILLSL